MPPGWTDRWMEPAAQHSAAQHSAAQHAMIAACTQQSPALPVCAPTHPPACLPARQGTNLRQPRHLTFHLAGHKAPADSKVGVQVSIQPTGLSAPPRQQRGSTVGVSPVSCERQAHPHTGIHGTRAAAGSPCAGWTAACSRALPACCHCCRQHSLVDLWADAQHARGAVAAVVHKHPCDRGVGDDAEGGVGAPQLHAPAG